MRAHSVLAVAVLALTSCTELADEGGREDGYKLWGESDDPSLLSDDFNYLLSELPMSGAPDQAPWAGSYWPTYEDSVNYRWDGDDSKSAVEKFEEAFHLEGLTDSVSKKYGIDSQSHQTACTTDTECDDAKGEKCSIREGKTEGYCVETWFGICHAWAPAAIVENEPVSPVTWNGVEFKVNDIKALISLSYDKGLDTKFLSLRCNKKGGTAPEGDDGSGWITWNDYGQPEDDECNDTNPGAFHVTITNLLGIEKRTLVEDRTYDYQVWNQPIRAYEVTMLEEVTARQANTLVGMTDPKETYAFNDKAVSFRHTKMHLKWIAESDVRTDGNLANNIDFYTNTDRYEYILELDGDGKIIGGEWVGKSKKDHPDFLWLPVKKNATTVAPTTAGKDLTGIQWLDVQLLLAESTKADNATDGFDWGSPCEGGDGSFAKSIPKSAVEVIGDIPGDKYNVRIDLKSDADVDVQLVDIDSGTELIAWPDGILSGSGEECGTYEGIEFCYSGYDGDGTNRGYEWIEVKGETKRNMRMRAFGYNAGEAAVTYSWDAPPGCVDAGSGEFEQPVIKGEVVNVGTIPEGKADVRIDLKAEADVDVQLFDGGIPLVQWPDGRLSKSGVQTLEYEGMTITWSGYDGDGTHKGYEYITIKGELSRTLTMRAFGYAAGTASVDYGWGLTDL